MSNDNSPIKQLSRKEAMALANTNWWLEKTPQQIALFQLTQDKMTMPFGIFHKAVEDTLSRPVFTHEFADQDSLFKEALEVIWNRINLKNCKR